MALGVTVYSIENNSINLEKMRLLRQIALANRKLEVAMRNLTDLREYLDTVPNINKHIILSNTLTTITTIDGMKE